MTSSTDETSQSADAHWTFARSHPVITFLLFTYAWSWLFWLAVIPIGSENPTLTMAFSLAGGYGPALGGVLTLHLRSGASFRLARPRVVALKGDPFRTSLERHSVYTCLLTDWLRCCAVQNPNDGCGARKRSCYYREVRDVDEPRRALLEFWSMRAYR